MVDEKLLDVKALMAEVDAKEEEFAQILKRIDYASHETKKLWLEIYHNASDDRANAYMLFVDLYQHVANNQQGHLNHGKQISMYLERMNKSNDQLLRLSELVSEAEGEPEDIDADALYKEFAKSPIVK